MFSVHDWAEVRRLYHREHLSKSAIAEMLDEDAEVPATVILDHLRREGYSGGITILKEHVATVRPTFLAARSYQRTTYLPGELAHGDWWEPEKTRVPVGGGRARKPYGWVTTLPHSAAHATVFSFGKTMADLLQAVLGCLQRLGGVPEAMVVDNDIWIVGKESRNLNGDNFTAEARLFKINSSTLVANSNSNKAIDQDSATNNVFVFNGSAVGDETSKITDASISPGRNYVVMRNYQEGFLWYRATGNVKTLFDDHKNAPQGQVLDGSTGAFQTGYLTGLQLNENPGPLEEAIAFRLPTGGAAWDGFMYVREYLTMEANEPQMWKVPCAAGATCPPQGS